MVMEAAMTKTTAADIRAAASWMEHTAMVAEMTGTEADERAATVARRALMLARERYRAGV
jgi:hypothetical protein